MTVVVDASVVGAALASADATGTWAESVLAGEPLAAPHLMPTEARAALQQKAALQSQLNDLQEQAKITGSPLRQPEAAERTGHPVLTSYQAWYVALAEFLGAKLATLDTGLALVPGPRGGFCLPPA